MTNNKKKLIPAIYQNTFDLLKSRGICEERIPPFCTVRKVVYTKKPTQEVLLDDSIGNVDSD